MYLRKRLPFPRFSNFDGGEGEAPRLVPLRGDGSMALEAWIW
jgi:hypothetical protein